MAAPTVAARTEYALTTAGTTATPTFTQTTGDLVVIILATAQSVSLTPGDGFTWLGSSANNSHVLYKVLDGSEGGNVAITLSGSSKAAAIAYNIQGFTSPPAEAEATGGPDTTPDPPQLTPAGGSKDYLWIAGAAQVQGEEVDDDTWCTAAPTDFTNLVQKTSGTGGAATTNCTLATAERAFTGSVLNPGTFTVAQSLTWQTRTVAISPAGPAATAIVFLPSHPMQHLLVR
jgi:hypothetical protein